MFEASYRPVWVEVFSGCYITHKTEYAIQIRVDFRRVLFFFQAEDGIRDSKVTGVQTSALRISYAVFCLRTKEQTPEIQSHLNLVCRLMLKNRRTKFRSTRNSRSSYTTASLVRTCTRRENRPH